MVILLCTKVKGRGILESLCQSVHLSVQCPCYLLYSILFVVCLSVQCPCCLLYSILFVTLLFWMKNSSVSVSKPSSFRYSLQSSHYPRCLPDITSVVSVKLSRSVVELSAYERHRSCMPLLLLMICKLCSFISGGFSVHAQVQLHFHFRLPLARGWRWHSSRVGLHLGRWAGVCQDRYADFRCPLLCSHS